MMMALPTVWLALGHTPETPDPATAVDEVALERPFDLLQNQRLTGDWLGARRWLEERGIALDLSFTTIYQHNAHGAVQTRHGHRVSAS
ncbi:MAG TPA: hypothetical protein PLP66_03645, partial [Phycisphaerae bacterium]|nr:hypothetical protein [Phycisphaerae bacterium]